MDSSPPVNNVGDIILEVALPYVYLEGNDVARWRRVSRLWRAIIDSCVSCVLNNLRTKLATIPFRFQVDTSLFSNI